MERISAAARGLAVILAIASAWFTNPLVAPLLLLFGGVAAIGNSPERNSKNYLITIVLMLSASTLDVVPLAGPYLATIFSSLGTAFVGASIVAITITLEYRIQRDWFK